MKVGNTDNKGEKGQGSSKNRDEIWESATWYILINILLFADFPPFIFCASMWRLERGENITSHLVLYSVLYPIPVKPICRKKCKLDGSISSTPLWNTSWNTGWSWMLQNTYYIEYEKEPLPIVSKKCMTLQKWSSKLKSVFWSISNCSLYFTTRNCIY